MGVKRLRTIQNCRNYVASLIRRVEAGLEGESLDPGIACKLGYLANILKGCVELSDIEVRISQIEEELKEK